MANQSPADRSSRTDQILDLLLDALQERQRARQQKTGTAPLPSTGVPRPEPTPAPEPAEAAARPVASSVEAVPPPRPDAPPRARVPPRPQPVRSVPPARPHEPQPGDPGWEPPPRQPTIQMGKMLGRLALLVVVLVIVINIPVTRYGVSLARFLPESSSLIIRDGLVLKGSGSEIYQLEDGKLRWISSLDAFEHLGLTWEDVHVVDDAFLSHFEKGRPIHVLLKCRTSPHIYRLENNQKRWIRDIDTFLAEGHVWEDVRFVSCTYLREIPDGPPIPEDAGPPPQP
jgi:hypothetical protein